MLMPPFKIYLPYPLLTKEGNFEGNFFKFAPITILRGEKERQMLPPEVIERLRREKEERDRPALELPLPVPEFDYPEKKSEDDESTSRGVIVIDLV